MNPIELITGLPNWKWKEHSESEILLTGEELVEMSDFVWRLGNAAVAGFVHTSMTNPPWMWLLLADNVTISDLIDFRRLATRIPAGTLTAVSADFPVSVKFAKAYGFVETGEEQQHFGRTYKLMRKE
jgi:hypothetical protein